MVRIAQINISNMWLMIECKLQLREQYFTVDCTGGVVQDYITCLTEISDCTNVMGITEVTLSEVYSFNSKMLSGITGPSNPGSREYWWSYW